MNEMEAKLAARKDLQEKEVEWHDKAVGLTEKFAAWINANTDFHCEVEWRIGYLAYFKRSQYNDPAIRFDKTHFYNHSMNIGSVLYETDKPYYLRCWKILKASDLSSSPKSPEGRFMFADLSEKDFPSLWEKVAEFFGFGTKKQERWEQLDLFNLLGGLA